MKHCSRHFSKTKMQKQQQHKHHHHHPLPLAIQQSYDGAGGGGDSNRKSAASTAVPPNTLQLASTSAANNTNNSNVVGAPPQNDNATTSAANISLDEGTEDPEPRYECAICLHWLNEPVLTSCGHRFCKSCMNEWLRENNQCCPLDNKQLSAEQDIFPDNYTRREIEQIKFKCPNSPLGCSVVASPIEVDRHLPTCPFRRQQQVDAEEKCPFASVKCDFVGRPQTNSLEEHLKYDLPHHMQLMLAAFQQTALTTWNPQKQKVNGHDGVKSHDGALPPPPPQYANANVELDVIQAMNHRIVKLEQRVHEQDVRIENLTRQLSDNRQQMDARYSQGTIVWEIRQFQALVAQLRSNANNPEYSHECYTSPYGYKFCARLSVQQQKDRLLSLHVHLMQCENDSHLEWPFKGRIKLCMVHPRDANLSQHDTIMTKPELLAFHQPRERISTRGFGFTEYANIIDIVHKGFCDGDRLVIKIQINIV